MTSTDDHGTVATPPPQSEPSCRAVLLAAGLIALAGLAAYANSFRGAVHPRRPFFDP